MFVTLSLHSSAACSHTCMLHMSPSGHLPSLRILQCDKTNSVRYPNSKLILRLTSRRCAGVEMCKRVSGCDTFTSACVYSLPCRSSCTTLGLVLRLHLRCQCLSSPRHRLVECLLETLMMLVEVEWRRTELQ